MTRLPSRRKIAWVLAIALALLLPAIWNRYPLLYSDSGEYLLSAMNKRPPRVRTVGYGLWMWSTGGTLTLWGPVVAQSLLLGALLVRTLVALEIALTPRVMLTLIAALWLTAAPWMGSEAMPDIFTGAILLATWLILAHWSSLGLATRVLVVGTIFVGVATHVTMPVVFGILLVAVAVTRMRRLTLPSRPRLAATAALLAASVASLATFNWARTKEVSVTRMPSVFVIGHLVESGLAAKVLADRCAVEPFALCPYQAGLTQPIEPFIWNDSSVFYKAYHGEDELRSDTRRLASAVIIHEPLALAWSVLSYGARQFVDVEVFDRARTQPAGKFTKSVVSYVLPHEERAMMNARQQREPPVAPRLIDALILVAFLASLGASVVLIRAAFRRGVIAMGSMAGLQLYLWAALVINALVCANLSGVFGRYQARLAWLLPALVALALAAARDPRQPRSARPVE
jgi:hypothetical protein